MAKWKKGWKIVSEKDGKMFSMSHLGRVVEYKNGVVTGRPKGCGPLALFRSRKLAREAKKIANKSTLFSERIRVVRCEYVQSGHRLLWKIDFSFGRKFKNLFGAPFDGTVYAEKIRII